MNCSDYIQPKASADRVFASRSTENVGKNPAPLSKGQNESARPTGPLELCNLGNPVSVNVEWILTERNFLQQSCNSDGCFFSRLRLADRRA